MNMKRDRPFDGQPWTDAGVRGATEIKGLTFRDLRDAFVRAVCLSNGVDHPEGYQQAGRGEDAEITSKMVYAASEDVDIMAVQQNLCCEVEKLMGIYPNIPSTEGKTFDELMEGVPIVLIEDLPKALDELP